MPIETIEIHSADGCMAVCRDLKTAVNRLASWRRVNAQKGGGRRLWLVDPRASRSYTVQHPSRRLAGPVYVNGIEDLAKRATIMPAGCARTEVLDAYRLWSEVNEALRVAL